MMQRHSSLRTFTLAEFAVEQRLLRREKLLNRLREEKLEALKLKVRNVPVYREIHPTKLPVSSNVILKHFVFLRFR